MDNQTFDASSDASLLHVTCVHTIYTKKVDRGVAILSLVLLVFKLHSFKTKVASHHMATSSRQNFWHMLCQHKFPLNVQLHNIGI